MTKTKTEEMTKKMTKTKTEEMTKKMTKTKTEEMATYNSLEVIAEVINQSGGDFDIL